MEQRLAAEQAMAVATLAPLERDQWWERATPEQIGAAWQTARTWQVTDPAARRAAETIREQVRDRHGIDVHDLRTDRRTIEQALADRANAVQAGNEATTARARADEAVAVLLAALEQYDAERDTSPQDADRGVADKVATARVAADTAVSQLGQVADEARQAQEAAASAQNANQRGYDTSERRQALAEHLRATVADLDAVQARLLTDRANAHPPAACMTVPRRDMAPTSRSVAKPKTRLAASSLQR